MVSATTRMGKVTMLNISKIVHDMLQLLYYAITLHQY